MAATDSNNDQLSESSILEQSPILDPTSISGGHRQNHMMGWKTTITTSPNNEKTIYPAMNKSPTVPSSSCPPPTVYGELSILGYNGYVPIVERNGRKNRSKFLLCKRPSPNGIKKSRHYIVKQPSATKAIQDKDLHSISYTFSRSQTIIVEYRQDENTDMFQLGRSTEDPIDFVVNDTISVPSESSSSSSYNHNHLSRHQHHHHLHGHSNNHYQYHSENNSQVHQQIGDVGGLSQRLHRQLAKAVGADLGDMPYGHQPPAYDPRNSRISNYHRQHQAQAVLLNFPQPNISNLPQLMAEHLRNQEVSLYNQQQHHHDHHHHHPGGHSSGSHHSHHHQQHLRSPIRTNGDHGHHVAATNDSNVEHVQNMGSKHNAAIICKRAHATQSTISRFACRILIDRQPPYTARIYAAGFDSSKNIFLGEKATKWEQNNSIDGLTTNGILLMHPKQGQFYEDLSEERQACQQQRRECATNSDNCDTVSGDKITTHDRTDMTKQSSSTSELGNNSNSNNSSEQLTNLDTPNKSTSIGEKDETKSPRGAPNNDSNNNNDEEGPWRRKSNVDTGGVWREVSVDGGIYAIRESRSAAQKGTRIEDEDNILRDGTLIDLCGATLLWRSVDGFKASPSKKSLEEKIDMINASRPQCPVGLNTLVIPRRPIVPPNHRSSHHKEHGIKDSHQPYVYLRCGHVQGYHDWGATEKSNQRTCPICLSVGVVARLSMGLEPSFYVDSGPLTHVFNPCGHMASEKTVEYWSSIKIPHGTHFFHSVCPFCATPLATNEPAATKLIFQDDLD